MTVPEPRIQLLTTPRADDLGLSRLRNPSGLQISLLPNGAIFALEHVEESRRVMVNRCFGSPIAGSMSRLYMRCRGRVAEVVPIAGAPSRCRTAAMGERFRWQGERSGVAHEVTLQLHGDRPIWLWRVQLHNDTGDTLACDTVLIQDLGLGEPGFLLNNEAYASQYLDHHVAQHPRLGAILMGRQNLAQSGRHPWVVHGCLEGACGYATDFGQLLGPAWRDADDFNIPFGTRLASVRWQHETACAALQSTPATLAPGASACWTFFGAYREDHPQASGAADLAWLASIEESLAAAAAAPGGRSTPSSPPRSLLLEARCAVAESLSEQALHQRYPEQTHQERREGQPLSFFTGAGTDSRHVVLRDKERCVLRRHGALLVSGSHMLPDDRTLCVTCWMHGVFGAQLTLGNTSFHRLWSVSRDPYNITRGSGLRMLVDAGDGWRLLTVPSVFEIGLADCRWIYRLGSGTVTVSAVVSGEEPAAQWRATVEGPPCRFLVLGQVVLGEQELAHAAQLEIDAVRKRFTFRPEPGGFWSQRYPAAVYHLVTSTPASIEAIGSDELLYAARPERSGGYAVLQSAPTNELVFAVVGSLTDPRAAESLAARYAGGIEDSSMRAQALAHWRGVTRSIRIASEVADPAVRALDTSFPWLVHDAMVHFTVPHGLEQYTGGAWGTRDVCQGPLELLLTLEHDAIAKELLRSVFAQQYA
ncbi:MAG TPA: hypothetical protein VI195_10920, partial [Steroidobacteraceae bacterium]